MKTVKKLLSVLICLTLILSCILVQAEETVVKEYNPEHVKVLNALGITDYSDEDLVSTITRGEFYEILCKTAGYPATEDTTMVFADLKPGDEGEDYAKTLYKVGIIAPDKNGNVYPGAIMTAPEAVALVMKVLGYGPMADAKGGYPTGYLAVAKSADVTDGLTLQGTFLKADACHLLYNALSADMMVPIYSNGNKPIEHKVEEGTNLLNTSLGIEVQEGVVEGIDVSRLTGLNDVYPFCVEVNGVQIDVEYIPDAHSFLGYAVKAYYTAGRNKLNKMIYIEKTEDNNEEVIAIEDITSITATSVKAYVGDGRKEKTYKTEKAAPVIYNGVSTDVAFDMALTDGKNGEVKLLDNTGDGTADVVFVNAYENFVVSHYDNDEKMIYHKYSKTHKISVDNTIDEPYVILYDETGKEITPGKIKEGSVLTVFESNEDAYQKYIRAYLSTAVVKGEIDAIEDDEYISINGTTYELDMVNKANFVNNIAVGAYVVASLDKYGKVADIKQEKGTAFQYGFLEVVASEGGLDSVMKAKIFTMDEAEHIYPIAKNVYVDDVRYKNTDEELKTNLYKACKAMLGSVPADAMYSVVRFSLNGAGEINAIDTIMEDADTVATRDGNHSGRNSLFTVHVKDRYEVLGSHVTIGPKVAISTSTKVGRPDGEGGIEVTTMGQAFITTATVEGFAFYTTRDQIVTDLFVSPEVGNSMGLGVSGAKLSIVERVSEAIDEDGIATYAITIVTPSGVEKRLIKDGLTFVGNTASQDPDLKAANIPVQNLKNGDIVRYGVDQAGKLRKIDLIFRPSTNTIHTAQSTVSGTANNYWTGAFSNDLLYKKGYVFESFAEGFYFYFNDALTGDITKDEEILSGVTLDDCWFIYTAQAAPNVFKYDLTEPENFRISSTTLVSLEDYVHTGADASFVLINLYHGRPEAIVELIGLK